MFTSVNFHSLCHLNNRNPDLGVCLKGESQPTRLICDLKGNNSLLSNKFLFHYCLLISLFFTLLAVNFLEVVPDKDMIKCNLLSNGH